MENLQRTALKFAAAAHVIASCEDPLFLPVRLQTEKKYCFLFRETPGLQPSLAWITAREIVSGWKVTWSDISAPTEDWNYVNTCSTFLCGPSTWTRMHHSPIFTTSVPRKPK